MIRDPKYLKQILGVARAERQTWEHHWQDIADFILPRKNDITNTKTPGEKRNYQILDNTGMQSCELLAGAMHGVLTNPSQKWFELTTGDAELDDNIIVRKWLDDSTTRMLAALNNSNFQTEVHEYYLDLSAFGTGSMFIQEDDELDFFFQTIFIKEIFVRENNKGMVDEVIRVFQWNAKQIIQEFGEKGLPEEILECYKHGKEMKWEVGHFIYPKDKMNGKKKRGFSHDYVSQYLLLDKEYELSVGGFSEKNFIVARWSKASGEFYGRGPGMVALPEVKMINLMQDTMIRGAQKAIDPPLQVPDDGFILPIRTRPGSINIRRGGSGKGERIEPIFNDTRMDFGFEVLKDHRNKIREAFYVDQFQMQQGGPQMTATEVLQRTDEKMRLLGPMLGRQQVEFLRPLIDRIFAIMFRKKRFLPVPPVLKGRAIDVRYSSSIAKAQRLRDAEGIMQTVQVMQPFVEADPTIKDWLHGDNIMKGVSKMYAFPANFIRDDEEVAQLRQQRAESMQQQQQQIQQQMQAEQIGKAGPAIAQLQQADTMAQESEVEE